RFVDFLPAVAVANASGMHRLDLSVERGVRHGHVVRIAVDPASHASLVGRDEGNARSKRAARGRYRDVLRIDDLGERGALYLPLYDRGLSPNEDEGTCIIEISHVVLLLAVGCAAATPETNND